MRPGDDFRYKTHNVETLLPSDWAEHLLRFTIANMRKHTLIAKDRTSRELDRDTRIQTLTVYGDVIRDNIPWLHRFYQNEALEHMQSLFGQEQLFCAQNPLYSINIHAALDTSDDGEPMRYERHVDWAPTALLYATSHPKGTGGELVVSLDKNATGEAIDHNCIRLHPQKGLLVCMDARQHPHYVNPLRSQPAAAESPFGRPFRVVVVMLFCTDDKGSCPENSRPRELDEHLGHLDNGK